MLTRLRPFAERRRVGVELGARGRDAFVGEREQVGEQPLTIPATTYA